MKKYLLIILCIIYCSCRNNANKKMVAHVALPQDSSFASLAEGAAEVDSIVILYYKDDRFRYYTFFSTDSSQLINTVKTNLKTTKPTTSNCVKEGTIYLYSSGKIFNTLYFNTTEGCRFLSFIFNGSLRRYELTDSLTTALQKIKPISIQPG